MGSKDKVVEKKTETKKEAKESSKKEVEVETDSETVKLNGATKKANLRLNVNPRKTWLQNYYSSNKMYVSKDEDEVPTISGSQYALTATEQVLCCTLVTLAYSKAQKTTAGLYDITHEILLNVVQLDQELNSVFGNRLGKFDKKAKYAGLLDIKDSKEKNNEIEDFAEKYACEGGNSKVNLTDDGTNFLIYLLYLNRSLLADASYWMVKFAGRKQVNEVAVEYAVRNIYANAEKLCNAMCKKIEEVSDLVDEANKAGREEKAAKEKEDEKEEKKTEKKPEKKPEKKEETKPEKKPEKKGNGKKEESSSESESDTD